MTRPIDLKNASFLKTIKAPKVRAQKKRTPRSPATQVNVVTSKRTGKKKDVDNKFGRKKNFNQKIDELNQETEILMDEIDKWQT